MELLLSFGISFPTPPPSRLRILLAVSRGLGRARRPALRLCLSLLLLMAVVSAREARVLRPVAVGVYFWGVCRGILHPMGMGRSKPFYLNGSTALFIQTGAGRVHTRKKMEREYILIFLFLVGTACLYLQPFLAVLGMCVSVVVAIGLYCTLPADQKWNMKRGGIGSRKID